MTGNGEARPPDDVTPPTGPGDDEEPPTGEPPLPAEPAPTGAEDTLPGVGPPPPAEPTGAPAEHGPSGTAVLPPLPAGEPAPPTRPRWAGRATVPAPPRVEEYGEPVYEQPRSIAIPVLVTVVVMLLLAVLGLGVWLILENRPSGPAPAPPSEPVATTTRTTPPTTAPTSTTPATVQVPRVTDEDYDGAVEILEALGLHPSRQERFDDSEAGTVLGTDPPEGTTVPVGSSIDIIVSLGPRPTPTPTPTATPTATPTDDVADRT